MMIIILYEDHHINEDHDYDDQHIYEDHDDDDKKD